MLNYEVYCPQLDITNKTYGGAKTMQEVTVQSSVAQQQDTPNERIGIGTICGGICLGAICGLLC